MRSAFVVESTTDRVQVADALKLALTILEGFKCRFSPNIDAKTNDKRTAKRTQTNGETNANERVFPSMFKYQFVHRSFSFSFSFSFVFEPESMIVGMRTGIGEGPSISGTAFDFIVRTLVVLKAGKGAAGPTNGEFGGAR